MKFWNSEEEHARYFEGREAAEVEHQCTDWAFMNLTECESAAKRSWDDGFGDGGIPPEERAAFIVGYLDICINEIHEQCGAMIRITLQTEWVEV